MRIYNTNYSFMFKSINFGDKFTVSISLVMEYSIYFKDIIFIVMDSLHTRLPHQFK